MGGHGTTHRSRTQSVATDSGAPQHVVEGRRNPLQSPALDGVRLWRVAPIPDALDDSPSAGVDRRSLQHMIVAGEGGDALTRCGAGRDRAAANPGTAGGDVIEAGDASTCR